MPRTNWLLAAAAVLPLLVPPSAVSYPPGLTATEISSAKVCGADECREVSDPEAATALAVGPRPRGTDAPERGLPCGLDRRAGRRRASGAHGGVAAHDPPPPRVDAASGARGTGVGTVGSAPDVRQGPGNSGIRRVGGLVPFR